MHRVPTVLQMEAAECGAASLSMVLASYGCRIPLEELRIECGVSRDGSKASNILKAARHYGLTAKAYKKEPGDLPGLACPAIIHWNFNHFVVLEGFRGRRAYINDPAYGRRRVSARELDQAFTGVILTFAREAGFRRMGKKPGIFRMLRGYLRGARAGILFVFLTGLALLVPGFLVPLFSRFFVDNILLRGMKDWLLPLVLGMGLTAACRGVFAWIKAHFLLKLETALSLSSSSRFLWHVLHLPMSFFSQRYAGEVGNRIGLNDAVAQLLSGALASSFLDGLLVGLYLILLLRYDVLLTAVGVASGVLILLLLKRASGRLRDAYLRLLQDRGKMLGYSMTGLTMIETIKSMGKESEFFARWSGYQAHRLQSEQDVGRRSATLVLLPALIAGVNGAVILILGGLRVMEGAMTVGTLVAFQSLMASFLGPVISLAGLGTRLEQVKGDIARLDDVLKHGRDRYAVPDVRDYQERTFAKLDGRLDLRGISFGYSKLEPPLIEGFELTVMPGARVALVGGSGSGKSTVAKLIAGLYQPQAGAILFDGRPRDELPREVLCDSLAMVDQDLFFFDGSIRDNLTLWDSTIPEERMLEACKDACIHDDIVQRPQGYDSPVEEGGRTFSGGQRQRMEIARALSRDPRILILDEATSALDAKTERIVDANIRRRGCTTVIVAHRLSAVRDCDEILVLDRGRVVERGTHGELLEANGLYKRLVSMPPEESDEPAR